MNKDQAKKQGHAQRLEDRPADAQHRLPVTDAEITPDKDKKQVAVTQKNFDIFDHAGPILHRFMGTDNVKNYFSTREELHATGGAGGH